MVGVELLKNVDGGLHQGLVLGEVALLGSNSLKLAIIGCLNGINIFVFLLQPLEILPNIPVRLLHFVYFSSFLIILLLNLLNQYLILIELFLLRFEVDLLLLNTKQFSVSLALYSQSCLSVIACT